MRSEIRDTIQVLLWPLAAGLAYFGLALGALWLTQGKDGIATIWPASGVLVGALLLTGPRQRRWVLLFGACASLSANCLVGDDVGAALSLTLANVVEALVGYALMRNISQNPDTFYTPLAVAKFSAAALTAAASSSVIAVSLSTAPSIGMFVSWVSTVTLGILLVVPMMLNIAHERGHDALGETQRWGRASVTLGLVSLVLCLVFGQNAYPLLFVPLFAGVLATYVCGLHGAVGSVLLTAIIGTIGTWLGHGPIHLIITQDEAATVLFFQGFLLINILTTLPLAAILNTAAKNHEIVLRANRWLEMSEHLGEVGHWRLDLKDNSLFWSEEVFRIHGLSSGEPPSLENGIKFYHPDDQVIVTRSLEQALETRKPYEFEARLIRSDGEIRYVCSRGEVELRRDGAPAAIFGIFQDVTNRALAAIELANARLQAEAEADVAMRLALTDALTGMANRRSIMSILDRECEAASQHDKPLSVGLLDIDHFKSVNDRHGHGVGDDVIRRIAIECNTIVRATDHVGRIGGEEFMLVLPGADADTATLVGERVRRSIERIRWDDTALDTITVSIGVATGTGNVSADELIRQADQALYRAKREGRNRLRYAG
jgi:diguanylate cyclase (GGDEF)-like protein/PAS domain S-box-containing protein